MNNKSKKTFDEFFILGAILFLCLLMVFCYKLKMPLSAYHLHKAQMLAPKKPSKSANKLLTNVSQRPQMALINTQQTNAIPDDDVISYTSSYYSFTLPYDLEYYTSQYGSHKSSRRLLEAHRQLYNQLIQNSYVYNTSKEDPYKDMISVIEELVSIEEELYGSNHKKMTKKLERNTLKLIEHADDITPPEGKIIIKMRKHQYNTVKNISSKDSMPAQEVIVIISSINDHLVLLANRSSSDFNKSMLNKRYKYRTFKKPVVLNIVNSLNNALN